jgi:hypothetical protein
MSNLLSMEDAPRTEEGLREMSRASLYRLAMQMNLFSGDTQKEAAFMSESPDSMAKTVLQALQYFDNNPGAAAVQNMTPPGTQQPTQPTPPVQQELPHMNQPNQGFTPPPPPVMNGAPPAPPVANVPGGPPVYGAPAPNPQGGYGAPPGPPPNVAPPQNGGHQGFYQPPPGGFPPAPGGQAAPQQGYYQPQGQPPPQAPQPQGQAPQYGYAPPAAPPGGAPPPQAMPPRTPVTGGTPEGVASMNPSEGLMTAIQQQNQVLSGLMVLLESTFAAVVLTAERAGIPRAQMAQALAVERENLKSVLPSAQQGK